MPRRELPRKIMGSIFSGDSVFFFVLCSFCAKDFVILISSPSLKCAIFPFLLFQIKFGKIAVVIKRSGRFNYDVAFRWFFKKFRTRSSLLSAL